MQTRPRPPAKPEENQPIAPEVTPATRRGKLTTDLAKRLLNAGLAMVVLGLAFVYVSKDWTGYTKLPGGRKIA